MRGNNQQPHLGWPHKINKPLKTLLMFLGCFWVVLLGVILIPTIVPRGLPISPVNHPGIVVAQDQQSTDLLQQGMQRYRAGQFAEAIQYWQQAVQIYQQEGSQINRIQALNYLAAAYQELGQWQQAEAAIQQSVMLLQSMSTLGSRETALLSQALNTQGVLQLAQGKTEAALNSWQQAESSYDRAGNEAGRLGSRVNQAQALQALGQYRRAKRLLENLVADVRDQPDSMLKAEGLKSLGIALQTIGDPLQSKALLEQSWGIGQSLQNSNHVGAVLFNLGNVARDLDQPLVALDYYDEAIKLANDGFDRLQAQLNRLSLFVKTNQWDNARSLVPQIEKALVELPASRMAIYARVNLAETLMQPRNKELFPIAKPVTIAQSLAQGIQQAQQLQDHRAEAYALTQLGKLYQQTGQLNQAKTLTKQAMNLAQGIAADDITARAAQQLGRIQGQQGNQPEALAAYRTAITTLKSLRGDLVAISPDVQFTFKESVEPVYREFVGLLLQPQASQDDLKQAREAIEALQLAELDNFFRDACLDTKPVQIDAIDVQAAVIYPIILRDRLEVVLSLPDRPLTHYGTPLSSQQVETTLQQLYSSFYPGFSKDERLRLSEQVYRWLIKPAESALAASKIETLVFVPDGFFRNIPITALYDGQRYLIERYSVALSPGLQLFPQGLKQDAFNALIVGLTEARQDFPALPSVKGEVEQISQKLSSQVLLDEAFTRQSFQALIDGTPFPIVHLATHGQFSSDPEQTFLLTWDDRLNVQEFDTLFQKRRVGLLKPIELLVLSACQTASGDSRATLGLAGLALRSGARSTVASLWSVNDKSTAGLMTEFYRQLTQQDQTITKAEALRQAQLKLLNDSSYKHPYFWASFVLIGNWL